MERCGREVFVALTWSAPSSHIFAPEGILGFEAGLMALAEKPGMVRYLMGRFYAANVEFDRALAQTGVHAHISGESYLSADLISPATYREVFFEAQRGYYGAAAAQGVIPIMCFWGDVRPLIGDFNRLPIGGLMMDESKKGFVLDVGEIRRKLRRDIALFGNVDSVDILLKGTPADVEKAVIAQLDAATAAENGPFVVRNGSPFCPDTPPENIDAMVATARGYRRPGVCQCDSVAGTKQ
jgi:uroporphyrinogen-III decarboxylase